MQIYSFLISELDGSEYSTSRPGCFNPKTESRYSFNRRLFGPQSQFERFGVAKYSCLYRVRTPYHLSLSLVSIPSELPHLIMKKSTKVYSNLECIYFPNIVSAIVHDANVAKLTLILTDVKNRTNDCRIRCTDCYILVFYPKHPDRLWAYPASYSMCARVFPLSKAAGE